MTDTSQQYWVDVCFDCEVSIVSSVRDAQVKSNRSRVISFYTHLYRHLINLLVRVLVHIVFFRLLDTRSFTLHRSSTFQVALAVYVTPL